MSTVFSKFRTVPLAKAVEANKQFEQKNIFLFERDPFNVPPESVQVVDNVDDLTDQDIRQMVDAAEKNEYSSFYVGFRGFCQQGNVVGIEMYEGLVFYFFTIPRYLLDSEQEAQKLCDKLNRCYQRICSEWRQYREAKEVYDNLPWYKRLFAEEPVKPA